MPVTAVRARTKRRLSADELAAFRAFLRSHAVLARSLELDLAEVSDLSLPAYGVLLTLAQSEGQQVRLNELADRVFLTKSGLTRLLDRLEERGLVARRACELDKRGFYAALTAAGKRTFRSAAPRHYRGIASRFADQMNASERETLTRVLGRIADANATEGSPS
jgi:DNA-binding MarR family transcriptional regulator